jgi:flagellar basal-body rod protein FlgF
MYVAVSGAIASQQRLDVIANNLANVNTTGFKADQALFESYMPNVGGTPEPGTLPGDANRSAEYTIAENSYTKFEEGAIRTTGAPLDVALKGDGFFSVMTYRGERFTRAGDFTVGPNGELVTKAGDLVLSDQDRPIFINDGLASIDDEGNVWVEGASLGGGIDGRCSPMGDFAGRLKVVDFEKPYRLHKEGGGLFVAENPDAARPSGATVKAEHLETSNVNMIGEMTQLITNSRTFETIQKAITENDQMTSQLLLKVARPA